MSSMKESGPTKGKAYWRSLDQLAQTPEFKEFLHREFPQGASEFNNGWSRRSFLTLMGASVAMAGLASCRRPVEKVVPYVTQPEEVTPGVPAYYATTMPFGVSSYGLLVRSNEGRPTKIEGNELHPSSLGTTDLLMQAAILEMYDPDRSRLIQHKGVEASWDDFIKFWRERSKVLAATQGQGLAILSQSFNSPTLTRLAVAIKQQFPKATWSTWEPVSDENIYEGIRIATGKSLLPVYDVKDASVILALDSDFLKTESESVTGIRGFADGRRVTAKGGEMNRLYAVESGFSATGAKADHRLRLQSRLIGGLAAAVAKELSVPSASGVSLPSFSPDQQKWIRAVAKDLQRARGKSLVITGRRQPAEVHALVCAINAALGNLGTTVSLVEPKDAALPSRAEFQDLVSKLDAGQVDTLVILGGNPVYDAPSDSDFTRVLAKAKSAVHLGLYEDETAQKCEWHIPEAHFLESWGDARSVNGTASLIQPLIEPLYGGHSRTEVLSLIADGRDQRGYDIVRETWSNGLTPLTFEASWRRMLHDGVLEDSAFPPQNVSVDQASIGRALSAKPLSTSPADGFEIAFTASQLFDGRFANNAWLQELPDPVTKLTWDNPASIAPQTARTLGLSSGDLVHLEVQGRKLEMPVWIQPGQAEGSMSVGLGYGRTAAGRVGDGVGFNTYQLRGSSESDFVSGVAITRLGRTYPLSTVQDHGSMEGRAIVREATLEGYKKGEEFTPEVEKHPPLLPLWDEHKYDTGYQWGMSIDLSACTACNACTIACQSENNIPVVGKEQVSRGREMHWIRIDRYYAGDESAPEVVHQPMGCQHCENAPCEGVCPVAATQHDREGLNVMVYNRCIGTRYCSNNCPYKVRRFNFFNYTKDLPESVRMQQNPDVTVRSRGVMEKCTYCVQRINYAKGQAKLQGRTVADGEIQTACQQACPAKAITFGDILNPNSKVSQLKKTDRDYSVLEEFNTRPRTTYLALLRNPNPELEGISLG
jgi:MoCo/4Fe-4S cofactor protein with predicted Tat translocation signal